MIWGRVRILGKLKYLPKLFSAPGIVKYFVEKKMIYFIKVNKMNRTTFFCKKIDF